MRNEIVAWYGYSESGAVGAAVLEPPQRNTTPGVPHPGPDREDVSPESKRVRMGDKPGDEVPGVGGDLRSTGDGFTASRVAGLFADVRRLDAEVSASDWKHLFSRYGLEGLIDLARSRRAGWPEKTADETVAEAIVNESLDAGYDAVSGLIGTYEKETRQFEPQRSLGVLPMHSEEAQEQEA